MMRSILIFGANDLRSIARDSLLIYMLLVPWLLVLLMRLLIPLAGDWFALNYQVALVEYYPLILSFFIILEIPLVFGVIFGLLMLDEKDEQIFTAIQVTPVSVVDYALYRFLAAALASMLYVFLTLYATGMVSLSVVISTLPVILLTGLLSVFVLVFLISFGNNKVEGLAFMKGFGILMLGPLAAYFWDSPWQHLLGVLPSYWPAKAFWLISIGSTAWPYVITGAVYLSLLIACLLFRFKKRLT
ncbi:d-alanyl-d-alanine carboxypeptidase [hydrocarbon metagenome]|uniref:D-alanyl-d-alanine carboxypeptidase n=1 Tax=hydrocarbon metagenome TaxID=938273 RepID=A0A0W8E119_9ZZZZ